MAGNLSPFGVAVKWVAIPAGLAVFGYYVVGPKFSKAGLLAHLSPSKASAGTSAETGATKDAETPKSDAAATSKPEPPKTAPTQRGSQPGLMTAPPSSPPDASSSDDGPQVEVSVRPDSATSLRPARRHHKKVEPKAKPKPKPAETPDDGSFGGTDEGAPPPTTGTGEGSTTGGKPVDVGA